VRLRRVIVTLDSMRTVATRSKYPEFQERREHSISGIFLGPEEMARQHVAFTSDVIEKMPGFRIVGTGPKARVVGNRGGSQSCFAAKVNIVIDGIDNQSINDLHPSDIDAIEAYREGDFAPPQYDRGCGVIVIWTKR
jgi:hypothetical protein